MKSTPIFLGDRLYHLRYDLNAVWDIECLTEGGFNSIVSREVDLELCTYLLWSGLKWDNPDLTIQDTETLIKSQMPNWICRQLHPKKIPILFRIISACISELYNSGWYNKPSDTLPTVKKSVTVRETIERMVKAATYCGYPSDVYLLTPNEINFFIGVYNERVENERIDNNFRMGMVCATIYNSIRKQNSDRIWYWEDFVPGRGQTKEQTAECMRELTRQLNAVMGGEVK